MDFVMNYNILERKFVLIHKNPWNLNYMKNRILPLLMLSLISIASFSQLDKRLYEWKSYLPYQNGKYVTQSEDKIYFATAESILVLDKADRTSAAFFSKVDGLTEVGIATIKHSPFDKVMLVAYTSSIIDFVTEEGIESFNDIPENRNISGDKSILDIIYENEQWAYMATAFGVVQFNTQRAEFGFTTRMNLRVNGLSIYNNQIYAATEEGIYFVSLSNNVNLGDFNQWNFLGVDVGLPEFYESTSLAAYNNKLFFDKDGDLYVYDGNSVELFLQDGDREVRFITAEGKDLLVGTGCNSCNGKVYAYDENEIRKTSGFLCANQPLHAIQDQTNQIWYADAWRNFRFGSDRGEPCDAFNFNSPRFVSTSEINVKDDKLYVAAGGVTPGWNYLFRRDGFYTLIDNEWTNYNQSDNELIRDNDLLDFLRILPHPENDNFYVGTYWGGLIEIRPDGDTLYTDQNSSLQGAVGDAARERIGGLAFDAENNLWMTNYLAAEPLSRFSTEGDWQSFNVQASNTTIGPITVDDFGNKWCVVIGTNQGVMVFNEGDIDNPRDDLVKVFTSSNSELSTNVTYCIEKDLDGAIIVGTGEGPIVFECGNPFDSECIGFRKKIDQEGIIAFLLSEEEILSIAVDGANRKWYGTRNGVFVQSPDGETQIYAFDVSNSPLFDNTIIDIAINQSKGEVFIATEKGLQSFRTDAIEGKTVNSSKIVAFPNPVRPDYDGPIAIKGLARDANVKITDVNGQLIFETKALGGQAIWNGRDFNGRKASTGVYLVFSTGAQTFSQPDAAVAKILFIK